MKKNLTLVFALLLVAMTEMKAQQDPMVTKYMFNSLAFNPAYAGSNDHLTLGLLHRSQWVGIDGAPTTQWLFAHSPLKNERVGVGINLTNDLIGPIGTTEGIIAFRSAMRLSSAGWVDIKALSLPVSFAPPACFCAIIFCQKVTEARGS